MSAEPAAENQLDPWVAEWLEECAAMMEPPEEYTPEYLAMARPDACPFPVRATAKTSDEIIDRVPVRIYEHDQEPAGLLVYFHGGGFCTGSIGLMENIATELAHACQRCGDLGRLPAGARAPLPSRLGRLRDGHALGYDQLRALRYRSPECSRWG